MYQRIRFICSYWLLWISIFVLARAVFLFYNHHESSTLDFHEILFCFINGIRMDASMASYFSLLISLLLLITLPFRAKTTENILAVFTFIFVLISATIITCDLPAFQAWGYRLDATPLKYLSSPDEAMASVSHLPLFSIFLGWALIIAFIFLTHRYVLKKHAEALNPPATYIKDMAMLLLLMSVQIIPLRGGWQLAPMNQSSVYFSTNQYANLAAINVNWNFFHSLSEDLNDTHNPFVYMNEKQAYQLKDSVYRSTVEQSMVLKPNTQPNIILIVWESFTQKVVDASQNKIAITPGFNQLKKEGIYFSDCYATGDRTDKGIVGVLSGYPAQPTTSIIKVPQKASKLPVLPKYFADHGYHTSFTYGGELEFANMKSYLLNAGFKTFTTKDDFIAADLNSKWGAHDGPVANKLLESIKKTSVPFFSTWLTLSSHEPFETPVSTVIQGKDDQSLFLNSLHYTDSVLYQFIEACKKESFWNNTLVIIVADHGHRLPATGKKIDDFKIPMLWLGGALSHSGYVESQTCSQTDIAASLLAQMKYSSNEFKWSKNIFANAQNRNAYFSFNNGFGYTQPEGYFIFDNTGKQCIEKNGVVSEKTIQCGKAIQQVSFADYLSK